jgi:hypothetical protein
MIECEVGISGVANSHQHPFPGTVDCVYCGAVAHVAFTAIEFPNMPGEALVCNTGPTNNNGIWAHDVIACAVYICPKCGKATAEWNQA